MQWRSAFRISLSNGLCAAGVSAATLVGWPATLSANKATVGAAHLSLGRAVYAQHCAACHGQHLEGEPNWRTRKPNGRLPAPPHDETGHTWHHPDARLFLVTKFGVKPPYAPEGYQSDMPGFENVLSDQQIWAVLAFIKSSWPADIRDRHDRINGASKNQ